MRAAVEDESKSQEGIEKESKDGAEGSKRGAGQKKRPMVWDDDKLARLLDRSGIGEAAEREGGGAEGGEDGEEDGGDGGLLGSINVWDLRDGTDAIPLTAVADEEEGGGGEGGGEDRDWDGLLKWR